MGKATDFKFSIRIDLGMSQLTDNKNTPKLGSLGSGGQNFEFLGPYLNLEI